MRLFEVFFFPPGIYFIMLAFALIFWKKRKLSRNIIITTLILFYLSSITLVSDPFLKFLEYPPLAENSIGNHDAKAIVVLGAGRYPRAPEHGNKDSVSANAMQRLRYAALLAKKTSLPILVSGGNPDGSPEPEALLMKYVLEKELGVKVQYTEVFSFNTYENAVCSKQILDTFGADKVYLVTQAWHMSRAIRSFRDVGIKVIPASTGYTTSTRNGVGFKDLLPRTQGLEKINLWLHEVLGIVWYKLKYGGSKMQCPKRT